MTDSTHRNTYGISDRELLETPTVFRKDLFRDQVVLVSGGGTEIGKGA